MYRPRTSAFWASVFVRPGGLVITPVFKEDRGGSLKIVSFSAKRARGMMAGFAIRNRLARAAELQAFAEDGYRFDPALSSAREWLFVR